MTRKQMTRWMAVTAALMVMAIGTAYHAIAAPPVPAPNALIESADQAAKKDKVKETIAVDVAEDQTRFAFTSERLFDDGMPQYGTPFMTQGYIYPAGTLDGTNGVLADGSPEFPELVIGDWTCYGWLVGDGAHTETGRMVVSTQLFNLGDGEDGSLIVSNGYELADVGVPVHRAINGGTGEFAGATGEQVQSLLGFTEHFGVNLSVELQLQ